MRCFGRTERIGGSDQLTALVLRVLKPKGSEATPLRGMRWRGRWALISQDNASIFATRMLACVPFDTGSLDMPLEFRPARVVAVRADREEAMNDWTFVDGKLHIEASPDRAGLLGFLVIRDQ
jgi:hypothetical protein